MLLSAVGLPPRPLPARSCRPVQPQRAVVAQQAADFAETLRPAVRRTLPASIPARSVPVHAVVAQAEIRRRVTHVCTLPASNVRITCRQSPTWIMPRCPPRRRTAGRRAAQRDSRAPQAAGDLGARLLGKNRRISTTGAPRWSRRNRRYSTCAPSGPGNRPRAEVHTFARRPADEMACSCGRRLDADVAERP